MQGWNGNFRCEPDTAHNFLLSAIASFGMTEDTASEKGLQVLIKKRVSSLTESAWNRRKRRLAKIIADASTGIILGASLIGPEVSEMLPILTLAAKIDKYPGYTQKHICTSTLSEILMENRLKNCNSEYEKNSCCSLIIRKINPYFKLLV